jgi:hypothetical protein
MGFLFTKTFIWGSYQGEFIFFEPMITRAYLLGNPNDEVSLTQPSTFQRSGWYPEKYKIESLQNPDKYTITLSGLTYHEGE